MKFPVMYDGITIWPSGYPEFPRLWVNEPNLERYDIVRPNGGFLGSIWWHERMRRFCLESDSSTVWSSEHLGSIVDFIKQIESYTSGLKK